MKIYLAKDWRGCHVFGEPPKLIKCGGMPNIWTGYKLPYNVNNSFYEDEIPRGQYLEREIWWSIIHRIK